jgi:hypothetical protein
MLLPDSSRPLAASQSGWMLRLKVGLSRPRLDRELAAGASPDSRPDLRVRAEQLIDARNRRALAAVIGHLLEAAEEPPGVLERQTPARGLNRAAVTRAGNELIALAALLASDEPIAPQAAARAQVLACDERGPLYGTDAPDAADACIEALREALASR